MPKVTALQLHTYNGKEYQVGDSYEAPDDLVASLVVQGKAAPSESPAAKAAPRKPPVDGEKK